MKLTTIRFILALKKKGLLSCLPSSFPVIYDHLVFDVCLCFLLNITITYIVEIQGVINFTKKKLLILFIPKVVSLRKNSSPHIPYTVLCSLALFSHLILIPS